MKKLLLLFLVGCGDTIIQVTPPAELDAEAPRDAAREQLPPFFEANKDAGQPADAEPPVDACVPPPASTDPASTDCTIIAATCPTCADGWAYRCKAAGNVGQPKLRGNVPPLACKRTSIDNATGETTYCCPPACVQASSQNDRCSTNYPKAWDCAAGPDGLSLLGPPVGCIYDGNPSPGALVTRFCCP